MKKKIFFTISLIILVISEISMVYADVIIPGQHFHSYSGSEKFEKFNEYLQSPLKEILAILIILFIVIGLVILTFRVINSKNQNSTEEKNTSMIILHKIFFGLNVILSLISIYMIKVIELFNIYHNPVTYVDTRAEMANSFMIHLYIIYAIIMFILSMIGIKKKNKKIIYATAICLTIVILIICFLIYNNVSIGYYTYDKSFQDFFGF